MSRETKVVLIYVGLFAATVGGIAAESAAWSALAGMGFGFWTFLMFFVTESRP